MANNCLIPVLFSKCFGLTYLAIWLPSITTAFGFLFSTLAVEFCCSETRACSFCACAPAPAPRARVNRSTYPPTYLSIDPYIYLCTYISTFLSIYLSVSCARAPALGFYKIFVYIKAFMHERIIPFLPLSFCIAHTMAILLHGCCAIYDPLPTTLLYAIHHTQLVLAISCKGQTCSRPSVAVFGRVNPRPSVNG